jgi:predicted nucleotidyltransferase
MDDNERKPTWLQIRDALEVNEDRLCSAWLTGSFATKKVTRGSDVDVVLVLKTYEAIDEFGLIETLLE